MVNRLMEDNLKANTINGKFGVKKLIVIILIFLFSIPVVAAKGLQQEKIYAGGGLGINQLSGFDDAIGFQFFFGYDLDVALGDADIAVEVGYMSSGDFEKSGKGKDTDARGLWTTAVAAIPINSGVDLLGRLGLDLGDDDGIMLGIGAHFNLLNRRAIRGEFVIRDNVDSIQFNFIQHF